MHPAVEALALDEKGFVLGALLARLPAATAAAQLGGEVGARCAAALTALAKAPRPDRVATAAELIALLRAPVPAGIELVHPGWLRERLIGESNAMIRALTADLPPAVQAVAAEILMARGDEPDGPEPACDEAGLAELRRVVFGGLVPLAEPGGPRGAARALVALTDAALAGEIARLGAGVIGASLREAPATVPARAAAADGPTGRDTCFALGLPLLAEQLAADGTAAVAAVAQRLPPEAGRRLCAAAGVDV